MSYVNWLLVKSGALVREFYCNSWDIPHVWCIIGLLYKVFWILPKKNFIFNLYEFDFIRTSHSARIEIEASRGNQISFKLIHAMLALVLSTFLWKTFPFSLSINNSFPSLLSYKFVKNIHLHQNSLSWQTLTLAPNHEHVQLSYLWIVDDRTSTATWERKKPYCTFDEI